MFYRLCSTQKNTDLSDIKLHHFNTSVNVTKTGGWGAWGQFTVNHNIGKSPLHMFAVGGRLNGDNNRLAMVQVLSVDDTTLTFVVNANTTGAYIVDFKYTL